MYARIRSLFVSHPATVGETYLEHMRMAAGFASQMLIGAAACLVHAVFPFLFVSTASGRVSRLYARMLEHRATGQPRVATGRPPVH
jgi:hypothetical protein